MKAKKILSLVLAAAMVFTLFCMVPSVSVSAAGETILYGETYGNLNNYSISSNEVTSDGSHKLIGGMGGDINDNMQTYASMVANGFSDIRYTAYVTFRVKATEAGTYTLKARIAPGGTLTAGYFVALGVNDKDFYKQDVTTTGSQLVEFADVELEKGINLVRVFTRVGETQNMVPSSAWVNFDSLVIPDTLEGLLVGTKTTYKAQDAQYKNYDNSGTNNVGNAGGYNKTGAFSSCDDLKIGDIHKTAYIAYTVTVAEDGYYNMGFSMHTGDNIGAEGFINAFVDTTKTKIFFKQTGEWTTKNVSLYIPAGTHTVTFTNVWELTSGGSGTNGYASWCDYGELFVYNGDVTLAATGVSPTTFDDLTRIEAGTETVTFKFNDPLQTNGDSSGSTAAGGIQFDNSKAQYEDNAFIDKSNSAFTTFYVNAPATGTYTVKPGVYWDGADSYPDHNVVLIVNGNTNYKVPFAKSNGTKWNSTTVDVALTAGVNVIQLVPFTRENQPNGSWMNVDYLDLFDGLTEYKNTDVYKFEAEDALEANMSKFNSGAKTETIAYKEGSVAKQEAVTFVAGADIGAMIGSGITKDTFKLSVLANIPYVAITVNAPADGWYDITASVRTAGDWTDGDYPYYSMLVKDGVPEAHAYHRSTSGQPFILGTNADRTAIDYTTYLTKGDHVLAFTTNVRGKAESTLDTDYAWMDFDAFYLNNGLTSADTQIEYKIDSNYYGIEDAAYRNLYQKRYNYAANPDTGIVSANKDAGFEANNFYVNYTASNPHRNSGYNHSSMSSYLETSQTPFLAYAFHVDEAGSYIINVRYQLGCKNGSIDLDAYYEKTGEYPYASVVVNEGDVYKLVYNPLDSNKSIHDGWWQTGSISANFHAGTNIVYLMGVSKELRDEIANVYVNYGAVSTSTDVSIANAELLLYGDANGDKFVNANDVLRVKKYIDNNSTIINFKYTDFNNDGVINTTDLVTMKKFVVNPEAVGSQTWLKVKDRDTSGYTVTLSSPDNNTFLVEEKANVTQNRTSGKTNIDININSSKQKIDGFGASLTDSAAQNMAMLSEEQLTEVMNNLFSTTKGDALGMSFLRQPIGASDFASPLYTYNDMPQGQTDTSLNNFSIAHDTNPIVSTNKLDGCNNKDNGYSIIGLINKAQQTSGNNLQFIGTPWTAPLWMKTKWSWNSLNQNTLNTNYYGVYAEYFVKYLKAYKDQGIDINYISPQNEASAQHGITSMYMSYTYMNNFVKNNLSGKINSYNSTYGKSVGLLGFDFNPHIWDMNYFLSSEMMNNYYAGAAIHAYSPSSGILDFSCIATLRSNYPNKKIFITEAAGNTSFNQFRDTTVDGDLVTFWNMPKNYFVNVNRTTSALRQGANAFFYWNIMLDDALGPIDENGGAAKQWGTALIGFNRRSNDYYMTEDYYALAHYSKFIRKGATILDSTNTASTSDFTGLNNVAAKNSDGSYVMVLNNDTGFEKPVSINTGLGYYIEYTVPARSSVSLQWTAQQLAANS